MLRANYCIEIRQDTKWIVHGPRFYGAYLRGVMAALDIIVRQGQYNLNDMRIKRLK